MRRESALAQGCAIADGHGGAPVSEGSGGSGRKGRDCQGAGLIPLARPRQAGAWDYAVAGQGRNGPG
jgi:hypothetical protein